MASNGRIRSFGEVLRDRIDAARAIQLFNDIVNGTVTDCTMVRFNAGRVLIDKALPSLQAVAIAIQDSEFQSKADIDAILLQAGLNPEIAFDQQELPALPIIEHEQLEADPIERPGAVEHVEIESVPSVQRVPGCHLSVAYPDEALEDQDQVQQ
jgi:hypothetical protein